MHVRKKWTKPCLCLTVLGQERETQASLPLVSASAGQPITAGSAPAETRSLRPVELEMLGLGGTDVAGTQQDGHKFFKTPLYKSSIPFSMNVN